MSRSNSSLGVAARLDPEMASRLPQHALCITGLQRSYTEFAPNVRASLASLYAGGDLQADDAALESSVTFFGVRPASDSWNAVRATLPSLRNESLQAPCGLPAAEVG